MWMVHVTWTKNCQAVLKEELLICQIYTLRETVKTADIITFMKFIKGLAEKFAGKIWTAIQNFRERMSFHQGCWQTKRNAVDDFFSRREIFGCVIKLSTRSQEKTVVDNKGENVSPRYSDRQLFLIDDKTKQDKIRVCGCTLKQWSITKGRQRENVVHNIWSRMSTA